jgi:hypothetical protein
VARERATYRDAGEAGRQAIVRALAAGGELNGTDLRVLLAVIQLLTTYSKIVDDISNGQLRKATGMDERRVRRSLDRLTSVGVIGRIPGDSAPGGGRRPSRITLRPGVAADRGSDQTQGQNAPGVQDDADRGSDQTRATGGRGRPASEKKNTEKDSEKGVAAVLAEASAIRAQDGQPPFTKTETAKLRQIAAGALDVGYEPEHLALAVATAPFLTEPSILGEYRESWQPVNTHTGCEQCVGTGWVEVGGGVVERCPLLEAGAA